MNRKEITILSIITFLTVIAWMAFGIYHARTTSTVTEIQKKQIVPLTPTFDTEIIRQLSKREE
ncbi:hypothetical protein A2960_04745 [Candidatus Gottesmanbacteria bacterium RIFCSPLOWO2_01_FULL_39_12b]|uniref:Uncharacterized protein n=1 Tax=Candidatus Gottesmanbacteria bacterium RIFCSPLOWO2_01_FULL_39_12b TaxID=1798388 RepID=A0A1F6APN8_9BACT|nr:MAG: hypothetical protein A2960_04745 [Candidatus Gottesmanbacteria bacterium RIFCSPLOWO2_01_FULL_39_12b]